MGLSLSPSSTKTKGLLVASLAVFLAHLLRETLESELGVFDFGLSFSPSLLGAGLDLFFKHLRGLGAGFRVMAQFLGGANHESRIGEEDSSQDASSISETG